MEKIIIGRGASYGKVTGIVKVVTERPKRLCDLENHIVVIEFFEEFLFPFLKNMKGIITEVGSVTSHPSILCREYKVPYIITPDKSISVFNCGDKVFLDGLQGMIKIHSSANKNG